MYIMDAIIDELLISEKESTSTERVRRYYKRHPEKVKKYLKKTVKDRVARNRDRRKAIKKYGKSKVKNHDVHHPDGPNADKWELAPKDHGRDTKAMKKAKQLRKKGKEVPSVKPTGGKTPTKPSKYVKFKAHNFKNLDLTFDDIDKVLSRGLGEILGMGTDITKNMHTESLEITVSDRKLFIVQSKSDISDITKAGVTSNEFISKYEGDIRLKTALTHVLVDFEKMLRQEVTTGVMEDIFNEGRKVLTLKIYVSKQDAEVALDKSVVVFGDVVKYNDAYKEDEVVKNSSKSLVSTLYKYQYDQEPRKQKNIYFSEEFITSIESKLKFLSTKLTELTEYYDLTSESTLRDYMIQICDLLLTDLSKTEKLELSEEEFNNILYRWVDNEEFDLFTLEDNKRTAIREYELGDLKEDISQEMDEYQSIILSGAVLMVQRINNTLVSNIPQKKKIINDEAIRSVNELNSAKNEDKDVYEVMQSELRRLQSIQLEIGMIAFYYNKLVYVFAENNSFVQSNRTAAEVSSSGGSEDSDSKKKSGTKKSKGPNLKGLLQRLFQQKTKVVNPKTGEYIQLRTALGYGPGHPAYDAAREWLKNNIKGIPLMRDPEVAILKRRPKSKRGYDKYGHYE